MTKTEKYIKDAIKEAAKDFKQNTISDSNFTVQTTVNIGDAAKKLAVAMRVQAEANRANSNAMETLANKLDMVEVAAIKIEG